MKSLNDSLREEFYAIIKEKDSQERIKNYSLNESLIDKAFEKLIENKEIGIIEDDINDARSQFQNLIVNNLKSLDE
ncbi:hypothetical protein ITJ86_04155 [Winogradskyella sp. F6397]|uniref:Uncharacterized protein n=1 Tax=Winogradskyella marina TaxID=2785530 RepID=A0ABS0EF47_9FLAO|nr:hypothetical protein [Winogradskyella marina]MBF8149074.1 hypothetical protein [Winogradskyella marina]